MSWRDDGVRAAQRPFARGDVRVGGETSHAADLAVRANPADRSISADGSDADGGHRTELRTVDQRAVSSRTAERGVGAADLAVRAPYAESRVGTLSRDGDRIDSVDADVAHVRAFDADRSVLGGDCAHPSSGRARVSDDPRGRRERRDTAERTFWFVLVEEASGAMDLADGRSDAGESAADDDFFDILDLWDFVEGWDRESALCAE